MQNKLVDLNNHLFEQLERLNDEDLKGKELEKEVLRSKAMNDVAGKIIQNASIALKATRLQVEYGNKEVSLPTMIGEQKNE